MQKSITKNSTETQNIGEKMAKEILKKDIAENAAVLCLHGDLGAGKTTFLQGFAKGLGIEEKILSPTFVIMKKFPVAHKHFTYFYHFDLYRLQNDEEVLELGFKEIISNPKNIVAIEWPQKISSLLPKDAIKIVFEHDTVDQRSLKIDEDGL
ncbi:tRNA (adenosine(37)-N6)-threonylcarbamoyltransferase complex ATPase subunit type 1 TsaE [Candidatus Parcubacteria bacterium]|nr:tRNA (adenosine(37)-N6)-threonylcarbamoyltransferase complex ATPase subunit type 1 TsaE [Candidatus Parcubacteria bacterium]